jgi:hypothetical protein
MAFPTAVNDQITDAVTQTNTKVLGDAPAVVMGNLYVATAQALANAVHNAVANQQQLSVTAQAATTMAVVTLLSSDTSNDQGGTARNAAPQALLAALAPNAAVQTIQEAIKSVDALALENAEPWANAVKEVMAAVARGLLDLQNVARTANMDIFRQAALCAAVTRMINSPEQLEQYQKIVQLIKEL